MLLSLSEVKGYLRIEDNIDDSLIQVIMDAAVSYVETFLNRPILDSKMTIETTWVVPESIRLAIYLLISHWYENRLPVDRVASEIAFSVNAILGPHRFRNV